jgi:hypothetical protein
MISKKIIFGAIAAAIVGAGVFEWTAPMRELNETAEAMKSGDVGRIGDQVDFVSLKSSMKSQLMAGMMKEMEANPFAALGAGMVDSLLDGFISPEGFAAMATGKKDAGKVGVLLAKPADIEVESRSLSRFVVKMDQESTVTFTRNGLLDWRLSAMKIPTSKADATTAENGDGPENALIP